MGSRGTKFCVHCGEEIQEDVDPCPFCGRPRIPKAPLKVGSLVTPLVPKPRIKMPVRFLIIAVAILVMGIAIGALLALSFRQSLPLLHPSTAA